MALTKVTAAVLNNDAVTNAKIADDSIDSEHYVNGSIDLAHLSADSVDGTKIADDSIDSEHYVDGSIDTAHLADDVLTYDKLGSEFTTSASISASAIDFSTAQVFTKTLTANTTFTFSNTEIGMVKDLVITGNYTLTLPSGSTVAGTYDGTVSNLIQVVVTGSSTYWYSISQPQT